MTTNDDIIPYFAINTRKRETVDGSAINEAATQADELLFKYATSNPRGK